MTFQASKITSIKTALKSGSKGMRAREALMDAGLALLSEMSPARIDCRDDLHCGADEAAKLLHLFRQR